ncbi:BNR-4 repeat-containing protein [Pelagicoccus mobilis]|nr:BNR-4 repeat-containing protein [Pelagicoccus mobilis]
MLALPCSAISEEDYLQQRAALIEKHSKDDAALPALHKLMEAEDTFTKEQWLFKIDQYLYGNYKEFQPIYDSYREDRDFNEIYDLDLETAIAAKPAPPQKYPEIPQGYFSENLNGNTNTGSALFVDGKVYIAYQGHLTDPYIASYDTQNGTWDGPYKAGHSTLSKNGRQVDSHGRPSLEINGDGHFHIIFGGHGGEWVDGLNPISFDTPHAGGRMLHVASTKPYDITGWEQKDDISPYASYTATCKMGNGDIYFFTRAGTHKSPWVYYRMKSGSQSFEAPVKITWPTVSEGDPIDVDTFYIKPAKISDTEILVTFLWHVCNFREYHNKEHYSRTNTYYMRLDTTDGSFYNVEGRKLELPITKKKADKYTLAYNSEATGETCFGTRPLSNQNGRPAAAYEAKGPGYREWRMVTYEDGKWTHGLPMPGTEEHTVVDTKGKRIKSIREIFPMKKDGRTDKAAVVYRGSKGETVIAAAKRINKKDSEGQHWKLKKQQTTVSGARIQTQPVRDESGDAVALVVNIRKAGSQRLYLWHDGQFRANPTQK